MNNQDLPVNAESQDLITIQRCPHDQENPYTMVRNELIRDMCLSPECRWLIIYLLSNKEGWKISVKQVINHLKPHMGKDKVYALFNEAIEAGYIRREEIKISHGKGKINFSVKYFVSESAKFKKCFRRPDFPDTENHRHLHCPDFQDAENTDNKNIPSLKKEHIEEEERPPIKVPPEPKKPLTRLV